MTTKESDMNKEQDWINDVTSVSKRIKSSQISDWSEPIYDFKKNPITEEGFQLGNISLKIIAHMCAKYEDIMFLAQM